MHFYNVKLDKERKLKFTIGAQMEIEALLGKKIIVIETDMTVEEALKMLWIGLKTEDKELTYEQVAEMVEKYLDSSTELIEIVTEALFSGVHGKKGEEFIKTLKKDRDEVKNANGPATTGTNS